MTSPTIKITYDLKPPANIDTGDLETKKMHEFKVTPASEGNTAFYTALRSSIDVARNQLGGELTAWRDIIGKAELVKEPKKIAEDEEEDEEDEEAEIQV